MLLTALTPAVWGTTYVVTTEFLPPDRPLLTSVIRALPAGLLLMAISPHRPHGDWWWRAAVLGLLNIGAFFALLFLAAYRLPGGVAALTGSVQPLLVAALVPLVGERTQPRTWMAGVAASVGVALLVIGPGAALDPVGVAAGLGSAASMAAGIVLAKRWGRPAPALAVTGWYLVAGGLLLLPLAVVVEGAPPSLTGRNLAGYGYLVLIGTVLAYGLWFRGIERLPVTAVSFLSLLSPVVATTVGWLALGEDLSPVQVVGAAVVLAALVAGARTASPPPVAPDRHPTTVAS